MCIPGLSSTGNNRTKHMTHSNFVQTSFPSQVIVALGDCNKREADASQLEILGYS